MKKILPVLALLVLIAACAKEEQPHKDQTPQDYGAHSSMNSLDYFGLYLPQGANTLSIANLELKEWGKYSLETTAGNKANGQYQWDVTGSVIYVDMPNGTTLNFFVGEGFIKLVSPGPDEGLVFLQRQSLK